MISLSFERALNESRRGRACPGPRSFLSSPGVCGTGISQDRTSAQVQRWNLIKRQGSSSGSWVTLGTRRAICPSHSRRSDRVHHRPVPSASSPCADMPFDLANS